MTEFENFFETSFRENLVNWFRIFSGKDFPCQPRIALVKEGEKGSANLFSDNVQMSVATMYACLVPQVVAKVNNRMLPLYSFCKHAELPVFLCGMGGHCHPAVVLEDAGLYPTVSEASRWAKIAMDELEYFCAYAGKFSSVFTRKDTEVCDELRSQVKQICDAILAGEELPTYLIDEAAFVMGE